MAGGTGKKRPKKEDDNLEPNAGGTGKTRPPKKND